MRKDGKDMQHARGRARARRNEKRPGGRGRMLQALKDIQRRGAGNRGPRKETARRQEGSETPLHVDE
eukprot:9481257-Pyramimonas_sp.AAC.1